MRKALLICTTGLGNYINFIPTIKNLKNRFKIDIVVDQKRGFFEYLKRTREFNKVFCLREIKKLDFSEYDIILFSLFSEYKLPKEDLIRIKEYNPYFTYPKFRKNKYFQHEIDINLSLLKKLGIKPINYRPKFKIWGKIKPINDRLVVLSGSCNNTPRWIKKRWDDKKWIELASILKINGIHPIFVGRSSDYSKNLLKKIDKKYLDIGLNKTAKLIKSSKLFIGIDGGLAHLAGALNKKSIVLFGPALTKKDKPFGSFCLSCGRGCKYAPCLQFKNGNDILDKCKEQICMKNISRKDVLRAIKIKHPFTKFANKKSLTRTNNSLRAILE